MSRQGGSVTIFGLIMMLLLSVMGATLLLLSNTALQIATNHRDGLTAQYWAEAGMQQAIGKLKTNTEFVKQTEKDNQLLTATYPEECLATGNYKVEIGPDPTTTNRNARLIRATAKIKQAQRQITAHVTLPQLEEKLKFLVIRYK
jgi:Tfp pilus assembly protein PilX